jgi:SNF2 family DNA or RNA helicase
LVSKRELLLADDMGLGKTIQAIGALRALLHRCEIRHALLVCPATLITQWQRELQLWAPEITAVPVQGPIDHRGEIWRFPAHLHIVGYETLREDVLDSTAHPALHTQWDVVILDEASRIKNRGSGISQACKKIPRARRWALTGTPLENRLDDLHSIIEFLLGEPGRPRSIAKSPAELKSVLQSLQLRRRKADVLTDLPPKTLIEIDLDLSPAQRQAYDLAETEGIVELEGRGEKVTITHVLELITRLKQICNCDQSSGESAKLDDIAERMDVLLAERHKALVFSQFVHPNFGTGLVVRRLHALRPIAFHGSMSATERSQAIERFRSDPRSGVLVLSLRAGGYGLNLQEASYVFHLDSWWNPATQDQADSRAHRMGQLYPVTVIRYVCSNTIEERIRDKLAVKRRLFAEFVDDVSLDVTQLLSEAELFGLFGIRPPRKSGADIPVFSTMTGAEFESWLAAVLKRLAYAVNLPPVGRDAGVDIEACCADAAGVEKTFLIQCMNAVEAVGIDVLRKLRCAVPAGKAKIARVVACPAGFSLAAQDLAAGLGVVLWDRHALEDLADMAKGSLNARRSSAK